MVGREQININKGLDLANNLCSDCQEFLNNALNGEGWQEDISVLTRYMNKEKVFMREKLRLPRIIKRVSTFTYDNACQDCKGKIWKAGVTK